LAGWRELLPFGSHHTPLLLTTAGIWGVGWERPTPTSFMGKKNIKLHDDNSNGLLIGIKWVYKIPIKPLTPGVKWNSKVA